MLDFRMLVRNPVSTASLCVCLWVEMVFYRSAQNLASIYTPIFRRLGAGRSVMGQGITTLFLSPVPPLLLIALALALIYKELRLRDRCSSLVINGVTYDVLLVLPFLFAAEFRGELQALIGQLSK